MSPKYCAPPEVLSTLKRDGIGWGHDLDCGVFYAPLVVRPSLLARLKKRRA